MRPTTCLACATFLVGCAGIPPERQRALLLDDIEAAAEAIEALGDARSAALAAAVTNVVDRVRNGTEVETLAAVIEALADSLPELRDDLVWLHPEREAEITVGLTLLGSLLRRLAAGVG